jgi:hypothetical protein
MNNPAVFVGGRGGGGVVLISVATGDYSGVHSAASVTTVGSNRIIKFTSSGTYTV